MRHFFFKNNTFGETWKEEFWFSTLLRPVEGEVTLALYGESEVFDGCSFWYKKKTPYHSLELISQGSGTLMYSDGSRYHLTPGSLYLLAPEQRNSRIVVPAGKSLVKRVIGLHNGALLQLMLRNSLLDAGDMVKLPPESRYPEVLKKIGEMVKNGPDSADLSAECYRLLLTIARPREETANSPPLQAVCEYMQSQMNTAITLEELAQVAKTSPVTLIRNFKAQFGCTPVRYLINLRLNYAHMLLQQRNISVKDAAKLCGYRSARFFSREYRKKFGRSPAQEERIIR